jgi:hypothetical protein
MLISNPFWGSGGGLVPIGPGYAVFAAGQDSNLTYSNTTSRYDFTSQATSSGPTLGTGRTQVAAAGNHTEGIVGTGAVAPTTNTSNTDQYTYSSNVVVSGSAMSNRKQYMAVGNATVGVFGGGLLTNLTETYTYANNATSASTNLTYSRYYGGAFGSSTVGYFVGGFDQATAPYEAYVTGTAYTYSSAVTASVTCLSVARGATACASTTVGGIGFSSGGYTSSGNIQVTDLFTMSSNVINPGTNLLLITQNYGCAGNTLICVAAGGFPMDSMGATDIYTYSDNTMVGGTNISLGRAYMGSLSSSPGGF